MIDLDGFVFLLSFRIYTYGLDAIWNLIDNLVHIVFPW